MILTDSLIRNLIINNNLVEGYSDLEEQLQPASFDVRLGADILIPQPSRNIVRIGEGDRVVTTQKSLEPEGYVLKPQAFILASSVERVNMPPDIVGVVNGRSTVGRLGMTVHVTAGYIDPGFCGNITLEIYNCGNQNIILYAGDRVAQFVFQQTAAPAEAPYGAEGTNSKYQGQTGVTAPRREKP